MGLDEYISGVPEPEGNLEKKSKKKAVKKTKTVGKRVKVKTCKDCPEYPNWTNFDFEKYYINKGSKHTIAFILSPMDFENLKTNHWHIIMSAQTVEYNVLFLPFQKCYKSAWDVVKPKAAVLKICREEWVGKKVPEYKVDLVVLFPQTKKITKYR